MKRGPGTILYWDLRWGFFGFLAKPRKSAIFSPQLARRLLGPFSGVSGVSRGFSPKPPQTPKTTPKPSKVLWGRFRGFQGFLGVLAQNPPKPPKLPPSLPKSSQSPVQTLADFAQTCTDFATSLQHVAQSAPNLHNMLHILHNMLHMSAQTCTTCCTCCTKFATTLGVVLKLVQHIYNVVHLLHNIHKHNAHHIEFVYNSFSTSVQNLHLHTICPMNPFEGKYPGGLVRQQPWPPSFACAKAETTVAGFLERQRLQFDMRAPLGRTSCFCIRTTVT